YYVGVCAEADDAEGLWRDKLPVVRHLVPRGERAGDAAVLAQTRGQALVSEVADYHPELERAEAATELHAVVGAVAHRFLFGRAKVFGDEGEGAAQQREPRAVERREVEGREEPLVRVRDERVGALAALERVAQFGDD